MSTSKSREESITNILTDNDQVKLDLVSLISSVYFGNKTHHVDLVVIEKVKHFLKSIDLLFACKFAVYIRKNYGLKGLPFFIAIHFLQDITKQKWSKDFYYSLVRNPYDMLEIASYIIDENGKLPNSVKKGFAKAFRKFDSHQLIKHQGKNSKFKLKDLINLIHPKSNRANEYAFELIMHDREVVFGDENFLHNNRELVRIIKDLEFT